MFTGLVESTAKILNLTLKDCGGTEISVEKPKSFNDLELGHSVANNGVCLTVTNLCPKESNFLTFDLGNETLKSTTFKALKVGDYLNLERPLRLGDRIHGHIMTGHVDEVCRLENIVKLDDGCLKLRIVGFKSPQFIWKKGSVVINGVSLTINEANRDFFEVCLIPETLKKTNLSELSQGSEINIEYDFLAKSVIHADKFR